ncbi:MAG: translocation/assembly module TamB domain-containing protein [Chitinophagaceae bacterium]|nr:translocation/assembly module TamB domain-containing protein [Chitinophagaceae bacterium]
MKLRKWIKGTFITLAVIILLVIATVLFLHTSKGKSLVANWAKDYLSKKLGTEVSIGRLDYRLPNWIELNNITIKDKNKVDLLTGRLIRVDLDMLKLLSADIEIDKVALSGISLNVYRNVADSNFSYQFLIDAFASDTPDTTTSKKELKLSVNTVWLDTIALKYNDAKDNKFYAANIGTLHGTMDKIDLTNMHFDLNRWYLSNTIVSIIDSSAVELTEVIDTDTAAAKPLFLQAKSLGLRNVLFVYQLKNEKSGISTTVDSLELGDALFALAEQRVKARKIALFNSSYAMESVTAPKEKDKIDSADIASKPWDIRVDSIVLGGNSFNYDNNYFKATTAGLDLNHINAKNIVFVAYNTNYVDNGIGTTLNNASLILNDKIQLKKASAILQTSDSVIAVKDVQIAVNNSQLNTRGDLAIPVKKDLVASLQNDPIAIRIDSSFVAINDIELISPGMTKKLPVNLAANDRIHLAGNLSGRMEDIRFNGLTIYTGNRQFVFRGDGRVIEVTDPKQLRYDVSMAQLHVDRNLLSNKMKAQLREKDIQLPAVLEVRGNVNGTTNAATARNLTVNSTYGLATINGSVSNFSNPSKLKYNATLSAANLETGKWISKDSLLGKLTGVVSVKGNGVDPKRLIADIDVAIKSFVVKSYDYSNINLVADYDKGVFHAVGGIDDEYLVTKLNLSGNLDSANLSAKGNVNVGKADLYNLKLSKDTLAISTNIVVDASSIQPKSMNANIIIDSTLLTVSGKQISIDTVQVNGRSTNDSTFISMSSPFLLAALNGKFHYDQLPEQITSYIQTHYFNKPGSITTVDQQAAFTATVTRHDFVTQVVPTLEVDKPIVITAGFDNRNTDTVLTALVTASGFRYNKLGMEEISAALAGRDTALTYNVTAENIVNGKQVYRRPVIKGSFREKTLMVDASTKDVSDKDFYAIKAAIGLEENKTTVSLTDKVKLNGTDWAVPADNSLTIAPEGFVFNNFQLSREGQLVSIKNTSPGTASAIEVNIDSFSLRNITAFLNKDSLLADGTLQADVVIDQPIQKIPAVKGELAIQGLTVRNILIGNAKFNSQVSGDNVTLSGGITGENEVTVNGNAGLSAGTLDIKIGLDDLNMNTIEAFSNKAINRATGKITGRADISGTISDPRWNGEINFDSTAFAVAQFNSLYRIHNEKIVFNYPEIRLDEFEIRDTLNNPLRINGVVKSLDAGGFGLDLAIRARNFIAVNAPRKPDVVIYGTGIIDANVTIAGTTTAPSIQGTATLENGSDIYYTLPQKNDYTDERTGVVEFIKADTITNLATGRIAINPDDTVAVESFKGLLYNLNLEVKKEAKLTVVIDPLTNDELQIQGTAQINAGIDENGRIGLNGIYNLEGGYYNLNYQFIKRKFALVKGSTLTFSGDPKQAIVDITAQYETNASAADLLGNEISENTGTMGSGFTQKIPFVVFLTIKGSLLKPELGFDVKLKEGAQGVNSTLADAIENKLAQIRYDVSAMNKQVFGLLIMNRFIGEKSSDFFGGSGGFQADAVAKESVSRFLTEAVNQIADELIKGVDLDINLRNYEATDNTISRTDVDVAVSKRLLDDRLTISVGKNFTVEGSDPVSNTQSSDAQLMPDINTTYKLSKDGRYMIRAYRRNQYEAQVDGYFIETGAVFSIAMDYNRFKELLQKKRKRGANRDRTPEPTKEKMTTPTIK